MREHSTGDAARLLVIAPARHFHQPPSGALANSLRIGHPGRVYEEELKATERFTRLMPSGDLTLVVLKGHLLIEEQLYALVERRMQMPSKVRDIRLRFPQLIELARALYGSDDLERVGRVCLSLNTLRNDLAHRLESSALETKVEQLENTFEDACGTCVTGDTIEERLTKICGFLWLFARQRLEDHSGALFCTRVAYEITYGITRDGDVDD